MRLIAALAALGAATFAANPALAAAPDEPEPPVAVPVGQGTWVFEPADSDDSIYERRALLAYRGEFFPNLLLHHVEFRCDYAGAQEVKMAGVVPAQSFPQPGVNLSIGGRSWTAVPNAAYVQRSEPVATRLPDGARFGGGLRGIKSLNFPGHPPYAELRFRPRFGPSLMSTLASGRLLVAFAGRRYEYPPVPAGTATRYREACAALMPRPTATR